MLSIKSVNALSHYTDWTIAHVHAGALGWNGFMTFGMLYWLLPRIFQTKLWSTRLATWHFWLGTIGILMYIVPIYVAGLTQGLMWLDIDSKGNLENLEFVPTILAIIPMYWVRVVGGSLYVTGVVLLAINFYKTWKSRPDRYETPVLSAAPLSKNYVDPPPPESRIQEGILEVGKKLDVWTQLKWHRRWERLPVRFTVWVFIAVVVASLFEFIPSFLIRSNIPTISTVQPYTPLELAGRDLYVAEGCYNCHSQMVRPILAETKRYGDYSKPGEFVYDHPFQWGSRRIGPDLARIGVRQTMPYWHWSHFNNPQEAAPGSIMPAYPWLSERDLNFGSIQARVNAAAFLGAKYDRELTDAEEMAREQAREIAAKNRRTWRPGRNGRETGHRHDRLPAATGHGSKPGSGSGRRGCSWRRCSERGDRPGVGGGHGERCR